MNVIGGQVLNKEEKKEQESIKADVKAEIAVVLPILPENTESRIKIELDYDTITQVVNDYIERYTIDPRINEIDYQLSTPNLPDEDATNNLKECLTGETGKVTTFNDIIQVDNKAIVDEKVTLTFELSVEENVYLDDNSETPQSQQDKHQSENSSQTNTRSAHSTKTSLPTDNQPKGELVIQSSDSNLYWQNAPSAQLYWENAPTDVSHPSKIPQYNRTPITDEVVQDTIKNTGSGVYSAMESTKGIESGIRIGNIKIGRSGYVKVGDNGRVYTNPHARGSQYYKIVGDFSNNKTVKNLGIAGKVVSYGTTTIQTGIKVSQAETSQEKGRIIGAAVGKVSSGALVGTAATMATSAILISIATAAGVAAAPVTIVVIAGCSIIASVAASNAVEQYGEEVGGNIGEEVVDIGQNVLNKTREELRRYKAKRMEELKGFRHSKHD